MAPHIDVLCSDIKSLSAEFYKEICPVGTVEQVLGSIKKAAELGIHVETRTNVIPTKNDDLDELKRVAEWIYDNLGADSPWHVTKFFPAYKLSHLPATDNTVIDQAAAAARLEEVCDRVRSAGLEVSSDLRLGLPSQAILEAMRVCRTASGACAATRWAISSALRF